ncbi:hypothetical protein C8A05DRAFT_13421 [Staphylotrichum tortipilum]|uniref:Protein phosphatase n=1 Tax=Staphylotrichum tortipilum TaxID=2831512 RepID=A0AAN6RV86_9PEZI|nr:hypothetical protein C8A05DRAFT_13421 [Staphylotrichum longicolle]
MRRLALRLPPPRPASHARFPRPLWAAAGPRHYPSADAAAAHARLSSSSASSQLPPSSPSWLTTTRPRALAAAAADQQPSRRLLSVTAPQRQDPSLSTTTTSSTPPPPPLNYHSPPPPLDENGDLDPSAALPKLPFRFDTGIALFAKRTPRPFPPPFLSPPSGSFSDPLSTHDRSHDRRGPYVGGRRIQGLTNGDDAVFASEWFICANDGVGAWSTRPRGHAGLWARLILHFWATAIFEDAARQGAAYRPHPVSYLQRAYEQTIEATSPPNDWQGTTTAAGAQLHYRRRGTDPENTNEEGDVEPLLYVTNLGDSQVMVVRPATRETVYRSAEQWHWFDCPRQLGTNSPDTPRACAVVDAVPIREGDVVLAMSDGVIDNLWGHEIAEKVCESVDRWQRGDVPAETGGSGGAGGGGMMGFVADEVMEAAKVIALDPFAESPFMEHAIEEGLASGGGKLDDISVVAAICRRNDS